MALYGDTAGILSGRLRGGDQELELDADGGSAFGDAEEMKELSRGGNDVLLGGTDAAVNLLYGDADSMDGRSHGGNDRLTGGAGANFNTLFGDAYYMAADTVGGSDRLVGGTGAGDNTLHGDARVMMKNAAGGDDVLVAGASSPSNTLYGDAWTLNGAARGGDDTLRGGGAGSTSRLYGDAQTLSNTAAGGGDRLIGGRGTDLMWGDAGSVAVGATTGADTFVFCKYGGDDTINDFRHSDGDRIDVSARGITSLAGLSLIASGSDTLIAFQAASLGLASAGAAIASGDSVTVVGVRPAELQASDFLFA